MKARARQQSLSQRPSPTAYGKHDFNSFIKISLVQPRADRYDGSVQEIHASADGKRIPGYTNHRFSCCKPQAFYKRHPTLEPRTLRPLDWARHDIYEKVEQWFTVIEKELHSPAVLSENVYNMDETGVLLSLLAARKFLVSVNNTT